MFDREKTINELREMVTNLRAQREQDLSTIVQVISRRRENDLHVLGKAITLLEQDRR